MVDHLINRAVEGFGGGFREKLDVIPGEVAVGDVMMLFNGEIPVEIQLSLEIFFSQSAEKTRNSLKKTPKET